MSKKNASLYFEASTYNNLGSNSRLFRGHLDTLMSVYPELFPVALLENGYDMHDIRYSLRQDLPYRRIHLRGCGRVLTILPSFIMPYWVNDTETASQGLRLRYRGTSYDLISASLGLQAVMGILPLNVAYSSLILPQKALLLTVGQPHAMLGSPYFRQQNKYSAFYTGC